MTQPAQITELPQMTQLVPEVQLPQMSDHDRLTCCFHGVPENKLFISVSTEQEYNGRTSCFLYVHH